MSTTKANMNSEFKGLRRESKETRRRKFKISGTGAKNSQRLIGVKADKARNGADAGSDL